MNPIISLSGANSLYVYNFNNKLYAFFGDQHSSIEGGCEEKLNIKCDTFDYRYEKSVLYDTNCWTIGSLLDEWFTYNNYNDIKTDFYFEISFVKGNLRQDTDLDTIVTNRRHDQIPNNEASQSMKGFDWIDLISVFFKECLIQDKQYCKYGPNVRFHYSDIRKYNTQLQLSIPKVQVSDLYIPYPYVDRINYNLRRLNRKFRIRIPHIIFDLYGLIKLYDILLNSNIILELCFSTTDIRQILDNIKIYDLPDTINEIFDHIKSNIIKNGVIRNNILLHRTAAEFNRLHLINPLIANKLLLYIKEKLEIDLSKAREKLNNIYQQYLLIDLKNQAFPTEQNPLPFLNQVSHQKAEIIGDIYELTHTLAETVIDFSIIAMDVYTLSRMFIQQDSKQIIVVAGYFHVYNYANFFKYLGANNIIEYPSTENNRCITSGLGAILNVNDFRNIYQRVNNPTIS